MGGRVAARPDVLGSETCHGRRQAELRFGSEAAKLTADHQGDGSGQHTLSASDGEMGVDLSGRAFLEGVRRGLVCDWSHHLDRDPSGANRISTRLRYQRRRPQKPRGRHGLARPGMTSTTALR